MKTPSYTTARRARRSNFLIGTVWLVLLLFSSPDLYAQLATWDFEGETTSPTTSASNLTATAAVFGTGLGNISFFSGNGSAAAYSANGWVTGGVVASDYLEVTIEADPCYMLNVTGISFDERRSGTGPTTFTVGWFDDNQSSTLAAYDGAFSLPIPDNTSWRTQTFTETLSENKVIFRIFGFESESEAGTWRFDNISIEGTVVDADEELPIVSCETFTETYNQSAPPPNTPSGLAGAIPADGQKELTIGFPGGVSYTFDLTCIEDDDEDYSEYGITLLSSVAATAEDGCTETLTNTYAISNECESVAEENIVLIATFADDEAPTVACAEFSETYSRCPGGIGPGSPPDDFWFAIGTDGTFTTAAGGSSSQTVDLTGCISDNNTDLAEIEISPIDSYEENTSNCSTTIVNEYAVRDECGNVADETFLVKFVFEDPGVDPTITCPADATVECGMSTDPSATGMATADDDCPAEPVVTFSDSFAPGCSSGTGIITRTWTAADECGGTTSCEQLITIVDTEAPAVSCVEFTAFFEGGCSSSLSPSVPSGGFGPIPTNGIVTVGIGIGTGASYALDLNGCVSDGCTDGFAGLGIRLVSSTVGNAACGQTLTNTYDITDDCGNVSTDLVTIVATFGDTEGPEVTCADFTETFDACPVGLGPNTPNGTWTPIPANGMFSSTVGGSFTTTVDLSGCVSDNCSDLEELERTLNASYFEGPVTECSRTIVNEIAIRDACGNVSEDFVYVKITITNENSTTPPVITCPDNTTVECGGSTDPMDTGTATATTECGVATITFSDNFDPGGCGSGTGVIARTWTATSPCGITSTCVQSITIVDTTSPSFVSFPPDTSVECGDSTEPADTGTPSATDFCGTPTVSFSDAFVNSCGNTGTINRTWTAADGCGNSFNQLQRITVVDTQGPEVTCAEFTMTFEGCPGPLGPNTPNGDWSAIGTDGGFIAASGGGGPYSLFLDLSCITDNCGDLADLEYTLFTSYEENTTSCSTTLVNEYSVRDQCGNIAEDRIITRFTIENTSDAMISCPELVELTCGDSTDPADTGMATATDACGDLPVTYSDEITMRCNNGAYVIIRTWTAEGCGTPASCEQFIILRDLEAPVFDEACQTDFTFTTEEGDVCPDAATITLTEGDELTLNDTWMVGGNTVPSLAGCVSDNCALEEEITVTVDDISITHAGGTCGRTIAVTFIADDGCGNDSEPFTLNYIFTDDTAPVFDLACQIDAVFTTEDGSVCPADATISLNEGDEITVFDGWTVGGVPILPLQGCVADNCIAEGDLTITVDDITVTDEGTCSRTITVTFIADDGCGNFSEPFVCNYTFIDDTAPVFDLACQIDAVFTTEDGNVCPADATISLNEGDEIDVFTGWTVGGIPILPLQGCVFDNCTSEADLTITVDDITVVDDGTCSRVITITFIADDGCGNFSDPFVCNYTFIDNTGPEVSFNGIPDGGTYVIECDLPSTTWDPLIDIGELTITDNCSAIDFAGITEVLTQLYDGPCTGNLLTRWQQVFTVQDVCGNTTVYTLFTEIIDTTPPVFETSPADVTIECDETAPLPELEAFDSCSEVDYSFTEVRTDGSCPNNYTLTRTWTATDGCGNASSEVQIVTVEDTTAPEFEFIDEYIADYEPGQNVFVECSELGNISQIIANNAVATDNCSGNTPVTYQLIDLGSFDCAEFGYSGAFISRWFTVDECGNAATASINWFLVDETAPTFQNLPDDTCADADDLPPVANVQAVDDCESASLTFSQSDPIDCDGGGQYIERTWTAEDACGNSASHTQRITLGGANGLNIVIDYPEIGEVEDGDLIQLPIDCDQDIAFSLEDLEAAISVADGCGGNSGQPTIEINLMDEGDCTENGYLARYRVNVSAMDACGNSATLGIMIDFVDQTGPAVSSPNELTLNCGDEIPMIEATDACGEIASMTFVDSAPIETSCPDNPVAYDRTWTVTDNCGNATTFTQSITVLDNEGPVFSGVPADMCNNTGIDVVVTAVDGCTGDQAQVSFDEVMSNEAGCGQVLTRTWTATDACGNTSTATQQVFFDDDVAPTIAFTGDLVFGLASGDELFLNVGDGFGDPNEPLFLTADDVTVSDNCATITAQVVMETTISEDCAADGYLARYDYKFIATDPCGNTSSANLTVFYVDGNAPNLLNVPDDVEVICAAIPAVADVTASDDYDEEVEVIFSETQMATAEGVLITRTWTATDKCGNTNSVSQEILVVNNDLDATFSFGSDVIICNSDNNRLGVTPTGGTPPYTYDWELTFPLEDGYITTDPTFPSILFTMGYITQTFTVNITDANGCEYAASVTIVCDFSDDEGDFTGNGSGSSVNLNVYPNPTSEQLMVKATGLNDAPVTVALYNLFGQELSRTEVDTWTQEGLMIDTRRFPNGTYLLRLTADGQEVQTREVVILH